MNDAARWGIVGLWLCLLATGLRAQDARPYRGYRLQVLNIEVEKRSDTSVKFSCDLINTGKFALNGAKTATRDLLVISYDESLAAADLTPYREAIRAELLRQKLFLPPGRLERDRTYKVPLPAPNVLAGPQLGLTRVAGDSHNADPDAVPAPPTRKERPKWARPRTPAPPAELPEGVGFRSKTGRSETTAEQLARKKATCFDLVLRDVQVLRQDKREVELRYTIVNVGQGTADLTGRSPGSYEDNLAVKVYLSGVPKLSRGALLLGGLWLGGELMPVRGKLKPGQSLTGELTMDIRKKTRYLNHLLLGLDAPLLIDECDRTNNTATLLLD